MSYFDRYESNPADSSTAQALFHRMAQQVVRGGGEANQVWIDLLKDMLVLRDQVSFSSILCFTATSSHLTSPCRCSPVSMKSSVIASSAQPCSTRAVCCPTPLCPSS
jgi:hypothetical protein